MADFAFLKDRQHRIDVDGGGEDNTSLSALFRRAARQPFRLGCVTALVLGLTVLPTHAQSESDSAQQDTKTEQSVKAPEQAGKEQEEASSKFEEKRKELIEDAITAIDETEKALSALDENKTSEALDSLALATGKLELIIARNPQLALAPVDVNLITLDVFPDVEAVKERRAEIEEAVEAGEIQKAKTLMRGFGSEVIIETSNLPLITYPTAIKLAAAMIDEGNIDAAKRALQTALSALVITESAVPLPIVRARLLLDEAEKAVGRSKSNGNATDDEQADVSEPAEYVQAAREQLAMAEAFGYGTEEEHKDLRQDLEQLDKEIGAGKETSGIFDKLAENLDALRSRILDDESSDNDR